MNSHTASDLERPSDEEGQARRTPLVPVGDVRETRRSLSSRSFPRKLALFGSTGSIGTSTLSIARENPQLFPVTCLVAGSRVEELASQVEEFRPTYVGIADESRAEELRSLLQRHGLLSGLQLAVGDNEIAELAGECGADIHVAAIVGIAGLGPLLKAIEAGQDVALANKESLVAGGAVVRDALKVQQGLLLPVDSEHSALFQCLQGERYDDVHSLTLTASGGPFLRTPLGEFAQITPEQAVRHPRWDMGPKVSIDSATMMNKALEMIEAYWLFGVSEKEIEVVIHPQSVVHSLVTFRDGGSVAQLSHPDMREAIGYALSFPIRRLSNVVEPFPFHQGTTLEFLAVDSDRFPSIALTFDLLREAPEKGILFNIANEMAVERFVSGGLRFDEIVPFVSTCLEKHDVPDVHNAVQLFEVAAEIRRVLGS